MNGTRVIELHKIFKRHKFTEQETARIIEFVETRNGELATRKDIEWLKWIMGIGFTLLLVLMIALWQDTKADIRELRANMEQIKTDMEQMKTNMREIKELIKK